MPLPAGFCILQLNNSALSISISKCRKSIPTQLISEIFQHSLDANADLSLFDQENFNLTERILMTDKEYLKIEFAGTEWVKFFDLLTAGANGIEFYAKIELTNEFRYYAAKKKGKKHSGIYINSSIYSLDDHISVVREWLANIPKKIINLDTYTFGAENDFLISNIIQGKIVWAPEADEDYFCLSEDGTTKVLNSQILEPLHYKREYLLHAKSLGVELFDPYVNLSTDWGRGNCRFQSFLNESDDCSEDASQITQIAIEILDIFDVKLNEEVGNFNGNLPKTAFCRAIDMGLIKVVKRMVELGADINLIPSLEFNSTPIEAAKAADSYMKKYRAMEPSLEGDAEYVNHLAVYEYLLNKIKT